MQATACEELGSPLYADLLRRLVDDYELGGVTTRVLAGHEQDPGPVGARATAAGLGAPAGARRGGAGARCVLPERRW